MSNYIPKEKLTAYERWEVAAFNEAEQAATIAQKKSADPVLNKVQAPAPPLPVEITPPPAPPPAYTEEELAAIRAEAYSTGHDCGYQEGLSSGLAAGHKEGIKEAAAEAARISSLAKEFALSIDAMEAALANELLALAIDIAQQVVRSALKVKPELILVTVREAISTLANSHGHPTLILHPDDALIVRTHLNEQLAHTGWRIIEDPTQERGGCKVDNGGSEVDGSINQRWQRVIAQLGADTHWLGDKT